MALLKDVLKLKGKEEHICDNCRGVFKAEKIKTVEPATNVQILTPLLPFIFVDKYDNIISSGKMAAKEKGDKVFACPLCDAVQLFGLTPA